MRTLKSHPFPTILFCLLLYLGICFLLSGCSPGIVAEIAEGVTEGIIDEIEEYSQQKNHQK